MVDFQSISILQLRGTATLAKKAHKKLFLLGGYTECNTCCGVMEAYDLKTIDELPQNSNDYYDATQESQIAHQRSRYGELAYIIVPAMKKEEEALKKRGFKKLHQFKSGTTGNQVQMWFRNPGKGKNLRALEPGWY